MPGQSMRSVVRAAPLEYKLRWSPPLQEKKRSEKIERHGFGIQKQKRFAGRWYVPFLALMLSKRLR